MVRRKARGRKRKEKERPVLFKLVDVLHEDAKRRKALRLLERQAWGLDFISLALVRAGRHLGQGISIVITDRTGVKMELKYDRARDSDAVRELDESVFLHLDDDMAVERFIRENSRR